MRDDAGRWYEERTFASQQWTAEELVAAKQQAPRPQSVSVVLPALDEERTIGPIVSMLGEELVARFPLIDELVVVDSGSTDRTAAVASAAGATVVHSAEVAPDQGMVPGKGEVLWKSLFATSGDLVVFVDADLVGFGAHFVVGLLGPLLSDERIALVKGVYERSLNAAGVAPAGGGRVTELVARPLLNLYWPELAGVVQPLAGEYAARRSLLEQLPFVSGYGVETGLLLDTFERLGLEGLAQVDLGHRQHEHQSDAALGQMAAQITQTVMDRLARRRGARAPAAAGSLTQFRATDGGRLALTHDVTVSQRPPAISVPGYRRPHASGPSAAERGA